MSQNNKKKTHHVQSKKQHTRKQKGNGVVDNFINNLPFEAHLFRTYHSKPYQNDDSTLKSKKVGSTLKLEYCGPGTRYKERYARGERGANNLDHAAMFHDFAYESTNPETRNKADKKLEIAAQMFLKEPNLTLLDKVDANIVKKAMKLIHRK